MHSYGLRGDKRKAASASLDTVKPATESDQRLPKKHAISTMSSTTPQSTYSPFLSFQGPNLNCAAGTSESVQFAGCGRSTEYCSWWKENQGDDGLFGVRLIGNASQPSVYTAIAVSDLAFVRLFFMPRFEAEFPVGPCHDCKSERKRAYAAVVLQSLGAQSSARPKSCRATSSDSPTSPDRVCCTTTRCCQQQSNLFS